MSEIGKILEGIALPSLFHLTTETATFVGTIKDAGMEEPISTYYFRYGASQVADVYLAGSKESSCVSNIATGANLFANMGAAMNGLAEMAFPESAIRVTPLAFFRRLVPATPQELVEI